MTRLGEGGGWDGPARVPGRPRAVAVDGDTLWASGVDSGRLHAFDLSTGRVAGRPVRLAARPTKLVPYRGELYAISVGNGARRLQRVTVADGAEG